MKDFLTPRLLVIILSLLYFRSAAQSTYQSRANDVVKAYKDVNTSKLSLAPQPESRIHGNSYCYLNTYETLTAQIASYTSTKDLAIIKEKLGLIINVQNDYNKVQKVSSISPLGHWTGPYSVYTYLFVVKHLKKNNLWNNDTEMATLTRNYQIAMVDYIKNINFDIGCNSPIDVFSNLNFSIFSQYLLVETFPDALDKFNRPLKLFKSRLTSRILGMLYLRFHNGFWEGDAVTYGQLMLEPIKQMAEHAQDKEMKSKAILSFQAYLVHLSNDYNQGLAVVATERAKGLELSPGFSNLAQMGVLFFGTTRLTLTDAMRRNIGVFLCLPNDIVPMADVLYAHSQKEKDRIEKQTIENTQQEEVEYKYVSTNYALASSTTMKGLPFSIGEAKNNMLGWWSKDNSADFVAICQENKQNTRSVDGENPHHRLFQNGTALIGYFNIPTTYADASGIYNKTFIPINLNRKDYKFVSSGKWLYCHTGNMIYALCLLGKNKSPYFVRSTEIVKRPKGWEGRASDYFIIDDTEGAWILETIEASKFVANLSQQEQISKFEEIIKTRKLSFSAIEKTISYNNMKLQYLNEGQKRWLNNSEQSNDLTYPTAVLNTPHYLQGSKNYGSPNQDGTLWLANNKKLVWTAPSATGPSFDYIYEKSHPYNRSTTIQAIQRFRAYDAVVGKSDQVFIHFEGETTPLTWASPFTPVVVQVPAITQNKILVFEWKDSNGALTIDKLKLTVIPEQGVLAEGRYLLQNVATKKIMDVWGGNITSNAQINENADYWGVTNQQFDVVKISPNIYRISPAHTMKQMWLTVPNKNSGTSIGQIASNETNTHWYIAEQSPNTGNFIIQSAFSYILLGVHNNGGRVNVMQWNINPNDTRFHWRFIPVAQFNELQPGRYSIQNVATGRVMDVQWGSKNSGATIIQYDYQKTENQQFDVIKKDLLDSYRISAVHTKRDQWLSVHYDNTQNKNYTQLFQYSESPETEQWRIIEVEPNSGKYEIRSMKSNLSLGTDNNNTIFQFDHSWQPIKDDPRFQWVFNPVATTSNARVAVQPTPVNEVASNSIDGSSVYPNPAQSEVTVSYILSEGEQAQLKIVDLLGTELSSHAITSSQTVIDVSKLNEGMYLLNLQSSLGKRLTTKLVIRK